MSTRVVSECHPTIMGGDDYTWVPSTEEFEALSESVKELARKITDVSTAIDAVERRAENQDKKLSSLAIKVTNVGNALNAGKEAIISELTDGEWKSVLQNAVKSVTLAFENKFRNASQVSVSQISKLVEHEMTARSLVDELKMQLDKAVSDIRSAEKCCEKEFQTTLSQIEVKEGELRSLAAKLSAQTEEISKHHSQTVQIASSVEASLSVVKQAKANADAAFARVDQRGI